jgi:succinate dehydrogenase hydrophobic anchor subunit
MNGGKQQREKKENAQTIFIYTHFFHQITGQQQKMSDNIAPKKVRKRISESTLIKVQAISGLVMASYLSVHFVTIACANYGPATFNNALNSM